MKRVLLYLILGVAFLASGRAPIMLATPPGEAPEVRAASFAVRPQEVGPESDGQVLGAPGTLEMEPVTSDFDFMAIGVTWDGALPEEGHPEFALRVSADGGQTWSEWQTLMVSEDAPDGRPVRGTELHFARGNAAQLRVTAAGAGGEAFDWDGVNLTLIDGSEGPTALELAEARDDEVHAANLAPVIISRSGWGANESYRFDSDGDEIWPREYHSLRGLFVHHTATSPAYPDPAAAVRSIYYYHAVTQGWGDIGYHYVVDQYGNIYQGRYGTEENGQVVEAGHALGYNMNTMGVSLIGNFGSSGPSISQMNSLKSLLADRAAVYGIDPFAPVWLDGQGAHPDRWFDDSLMGHRDSHNPPRTSCPGDVLYGRLGEIRQYVAENGSEIIAVDLVEPADGSTVDGLFTVRSDATPNVQRVEYFLDGSYLGAATAPPWTISVASASLPAGTFELKARATTGLGGQDVDGATISVAEIAGDGPVSRAPLFDDEASYIYLPLVGTAPRPAVCQELLPNGHFSGNTGWTMLLGDYAARYSVDHIVTGPRALRVGMAQGDNYQGFSSARTLVTIPPNAVSATLTLQYLPKSGENPGNDGQYIGLLDRNGNYMRSIIPYGETSNSDEWIPVTFDLTEHAGETVYLYIAAKNNGSDGATSLHVDEASIQACVPQ